MRKRDMGAIREREILYKGRERDTCDVEIEW